ncbi:MAG: HEAT repeat domain-containing protein [bacterium]
MNIRSSPYRLSAWFAMSQEERSWMWPLSASLFFLTVANLIIWTVLQTFVMKRLGVSYLPYFYIASSLAILAGAWFAGVIKRKHPVAQTAIFTFGAGLGALLLFFWQLGLVGDESFYALGAFTVFGLLVNSAALGVALSKLSITGTYVFNGEQVQRLSPVLSTTATVAGLAAGVLLGWASEAVDPSVWYIISALFIFLSLPWLVSLHRRLRKTGSLTLPPVGEVSRGPWYSRLGIGNDFPDRKVKNFLYMLGLVIGLSWIFTRIFNYEFSVAVDSSYPTEEAVNAFFGWYAVVFSAGSVLFDNVIQRWLLKALGLTQNLFVPPLVVLFGVLAIFAWPVFPVVITALYVRDMVVSVQDTAYKTMLEGISDYQRNQAWTWLDGSVATIGGIVGSLLVIAINEWFGSSGASAEIRTLSVFALLFLAIRLFLNVRLRRQYPDVLLSSLNQGDFKTRIRAVEAMAEVKFMKDHHLGSLLDIVRNSSEPLALRLAAVRTLSVIKDPSSLRVLAKFLDDGEEELRRECVRAIGLFDYEPSQLYESGFSRYDLAIKLRNILSKEQSSVIVNEILLALVALQDSKVIPLLLETLQSTEPAVQLSCLRAFRRFHDPAIIDHLRPFLSGQNPKLKAHTVATLWQFSWEQSRLLPVLDDFLSDKQRVEWYNQGLYLIGSLHLKQKKQIVMEALSKREFSLEAAIALLKLGDEAGRAVLEQVFANGSLEDALRIEHFAANEGVPKEQQQMISSLIHQHHLHYPPSLPVSEPLRVRLRDIPKECLQTLLLYYQGSDCVDDRKKIEQALTNKSFSSVKGKIVLVDLASPWREMAAIFLLARGYQVRQIEESGQALSGETMIGLEHHTLPVGAIVLTESAVANISYQAVVMSHYAPSEVLKFLS